MGNAIPQAYVVWPGRARHGQVWPGRARLGQAGFGMVRHG